MKVIGCRALVMLALMLVGGALQGCGKELFSDSESRTDRQLRYYDNDSATQTTQARKASVGSPFGMPASGAAQQ